MSSPVLRPLSLGEVLDVSFGLYRQRFSPVVLIAIATGIIPLVLTVYAQATGGLLAHVKLTIGVMLISFLFNGLGTAATTLLISGAYLDRDVSVGEAIGGALRVFGKILVLTLLLELVVAVGMLALVVPGLILLSGLTIAFAVIVLEQPMSGMQALNRAWELSSGGRWKVFGSMVTYFVMMLIPIVLAGVVASFLPGSVHLQHTVRDVLTGVLGIVLRPYYHIMVTVLYYDFRVRKEGLDLELMAAASFQPA